MASGSHGYRCVAKYLVQVIAFVGLSANTLTIQAQTAHDVLSATGITNGLCVHVGVGDGTLTAELHNEGKILVHGLAGDFASAHSARKHIAAKGVYGLVSVEVPLTMKTLPYGDNLANLVVADLDALEQSAPSEAECLRVTVPGGSTYLKKGGSWSVTVKPVPEGSDGWGHYNYGPEGNAVSGDRLIKPSNRVKWVGGLDRRASGVPSMGVRADNGRLFHEYRWPDLGIYMLGRDAYNGLPLWRRPLEGKDGLDYRGQFPVIASGGKLYLQSKWEAPMEVLDAATGRAERVFDQGGTWESTSVHRGVPGHAVHISDLLIQAYGKSLYVLNAADGSLRWRYDSPSGAVLYPVTNEQGTRVFFCEGPNRSSLSRWEEGIVDAVLAYDLATGERLWRNTEAGGRWLSQIVWHKDGLAVFKAMSIGGDAGKPYVGNIRLTDGKLLWGKDYKESGDIGTRDVGQVLLVRDGTIYVAEAAMLCGFDPVTGDRKVFYKKDSWVNCSRTRATEDWWIFSNISYADSNLNATRIYAARSTCATGSFPAYGLIYSTPNWCDCYRNEKGFVALSSEPFPEPMAAEDRLRSWAGETGAGGALISSSSLERFDTSLIVAEWVNNFMYDNRENTTTPVDAGSLTLTARIHEHTLEATDGSGVVWSFTTGGRISTEPVVADGRVYVASHDGFVYCLGLTDGAPRWRFLAAPLEWKMVGYGQLESAWPVQGIAMHDGEVCVSAGRQSETDGGIYLYGLNPANGIVSWTVHLYSPPDLFGPSKGNTANRKHVLNGRLTSMDGQLVLQYPKANKREGYGYVGVASYPLDIEGWKGLTIDPRTATTVHTTRAGSRSTPGGKRTYAVYVGDGLVLNSRLPGAGPVSIELYDNRGRLLQRLRGRSSSKAGHGSFPMRLPAGGAGPFLVRLVWNGKTMAAKQIVVAR